jgi:hypothetical protein
MSDKTGEARSARGGSSRILGGLMASAILGVPVVPAAVSVAGERAGSASETATYAACEATSAEPAATSIQSQFRTSFTPGVVAETATDPALIIICC